MNKPLTLEDVAEVCIDCRDHVIPSDRNYLVRYRYFNEQAALCRAAERVVEEARNHDCDGHKDFYDEFCPMCTVLTAYDAISKGEK
jgi:hypothetical protein